MTQDRTTSQSALMLLGRLFLAAIFIMGGIGKVGAAAATQTGFAKLGLPLPEAAYALAVVVELGGGLAILFGLLTRPAGLVLAAWCVATALIAHTNFADRAMEINFMKNMCMTGGFLYVAAFGAGAFSLDAWLRRGPQLTARA